MLVFIQSPASKIHYLLSGSMIIDFHTHILPPEIIGRRDEIAGREEWFDALYSDPAARLATAEELIAEMNRTGIDKSVVCGFAFDSLDLCRECNSYVADAVRRWPGRLYGFAVIPPLVPGSGAELERCAALGFRGIGELMPDGQGFDLDEPEHLRPLAETAESLQLPLLIHMSEPVGHHYPGKGLTTPEKGISFSRAFPELTLIFAHWGGGLPFYELMPEVRRDLMRVYYDCAAGPYLYESAVFPIAVKMVGHEKILLGSDFPLMPPDRYLRELDEAGLGEKELAAITGGNAMRILGED